MTALEAEIARSQGIVAAAGLDDVAVAYGPVHQKFTLRWAVVHLIEEYARHCGHADLIRQRIDGRTED